MAVAQGASSSDPKALVGAWETKWTDHNGEAWTVMAIVADGFWAEGRYRGDEPAFAMAAGGRYQVRDGTLVLTYEFHSRRSDKVGVKDVHRVRIDGDALYLDDHRPWRRVDAGVPGVLSGAWLISGRMRQGLMRRRSVDKSRKTMKILSGTRFQWIAYDTATKKFMATGGGSYTTKAGRYTETVRFFSRDDKRVGAVLPFDYALVDGEWHHKGKSSRGQPLHEIWVRR